MRLEDLGLVGNCQCSALIDRRGAVVWCCLPRFDAEPVFASLLDPKGGEFLVGAPSGEPGTQRYLDNTNILETTFHSPSGSFRVIDFIPRFTLHDRMFRPTQLIRILEPISGMPQVSVRCEPVRGWSKEPPRPVQGSHHIDFEGFPAAFRLTTDLSLSYLSGHPFALTERKHLVLTWGDKVEEPLAPLCERFFSGTQRYWQRWVKHCNIPPLYQREVIRSALALKLHCFEDTGAIIAATTTSIPESPDASGRTWDYRYCWLRDAYYVLGALQRLGHFEERESFLTYLLGIASSEDLKLQPLYRVDGRTDLEEKVLTNWAGFEGHGPVRIGNGAALHTQNDIFGEMVLALVPIFMDERFSAERSRGAFELLERLAGKAVEVAGQPDAGIWELRTEWVPQTFSSLMSWAASDRMARVCADHAPAHKARFTEAAQRIREQIHGNAWNAKLGSFTGAWGGSDLDASLLQMAPLRMLDKDDPHLIATVDKIWKELSGEGWLFRYRLNDGFGTPTVAFIICTFWMVEALAVLGRMDEARQVLVRAQSALSPLGLLAEDYETRTLRMWGNFPQAYSHVGLIHAAFAASPRWSDVL
jgi:GH15 family glucan-1,4-alpha-glucosidase